LNEIDTEETEEVDERSDEGNNGGDFGESNDMERSGATALVTPAVEEILRDGEK
jgi:hypothetical protein